jgi:hypothetical protein
LNLIDDSNDKSSAAMPDPGHHGQRVNGECIMNAMLWAKTLGIAAMLGAAIPASGVTVSSPAMARGGDGGGGGGSAGGGGEGGAGNGSVNDAYSTLTPGRVPPGRNPPGRGGPIVIRAIDRGPPSCLDYRRGLYGSYRYRYPIRCQPFLYPYEID